MNELTSKIYEKGESFLWLKSNTLATTIKQQDLTHNIDLSRVPYTTRKDNKSIKQYQRESAYLRKLKTVPSINLLK